MAKVLIHCWAKGAIRSGVGKIGDFHWNPQFERYIYKDRFYDPTRDEDIEDFRKDSKLIRYTYFEDPLLNQIEVDIVERPYPNLAKAREALAKKEVAKKQVPEKKPKAKTKVATKKKAAAKKKVTGGRKTTQRRSPAKVVSPGRG